MCFPPDASQPARTKKKKRPAPTKVDERADVCLDDVVRTCKGIAGLAEACKDFPSLVNDASPSPPPTTESGGAGAVQYAGQPKIIMLGTGASLPSKFRNVSSVLLGFTPPAESRVSDQSAVRTPGAPVDASDASESVTTVPDALVMFDCGEGTLGQLQRTFGVDTSEQAILNLRVIFISHMHADHHLGLINVLLRRQAIIDRIVVSVIDCNVNSIAVCNVNSIAECNVNSMIDILLSRLLTALLTYC